MRCSSRSMRSLWSIGRNSSSSAACGSWTGVKVQGLLARWNEDLVLISESALSANGLIQQGRQGSRVCEKSGKRLVEDVLAAGREQGFRRRVDVPYK